MKKIKDSNKNVNVNIENNVNIYYENYENYEENDDDDELLNSSEWMNDLGINTGLY